MRQVLQGILDQLNSGSPTGMSVFYPGISCNIPDSVDYTATLTALKTALQNEINNLPPDTNE